jgi:phosphoglycolate phosphatase-like HAD superfamily hydrolase
MHRELKNLIVFDMDGVIVDVSESYRDTVRQTARLFFKGAPGWENLPDPLFSLHDLANIKQLGGLNNDWELTYHVLDLLLTRVIIPGLPTEADPWLLHEQSVKGCDLERLIEFLTSQDSPLDHLRQEVGKHRSQFIQKLSSNDVGSGNIVKQIFQEIYLGQNLYESIYDQPVKFYTEDGLINRESLLIEPVVFDMLAEKNLLALATGRPEAEVEYALNHFNIRPYFRSVFSLDDCLREETRLLEKRHHTISLSKPHPFMLDAIAQIHANETSHRYYIGDMPDDMVAASRSEHGYKGIGMVTSAPDKTKLQQALRASGADHVIHDISELLDILTREDSIH